ncbi:serine/threonine-protein kinase [Streptomyces sp. IBSBF 2435]|uniref:serine/threonine-protein kinase n=1 Tax=Streptomyces sp. IBSBF 2435 TaxID=2903531 RepID=UPI002FDBF071
MVAPADEGRLVAGRYRLMERIGRGGMGTVWRAEDELLDRQVAVKKLHPPQPHMLEEELATLFERTRREARAAARISHPNVIVVHDVVDDAGLPSIVMEYVPSVTLGERLKEGGALPPAEAARIGRGMVAALRAAHRAGVLHRDVKPGNVLLGDGGRIVLTDFGIAQASGTSTLTRTGELIGSIDFLSPERIRGAMPGPEADLWALGATLYQAVEGESPFRRPTAIETAYAIAEDPVVPPPNAGALTEVIAGLLAKEPAERLSAEEAERMLRIPAGDQDTAVVEQVKVTEPLPVSDPASAGRGGAPAHAGHTPPHGGAPGAYSTTGQPPPYSAPHGGDRRRPGRWIAAAAAVAVLAGGTAVAVDRAHRSDAAGGDGGPTGAPTATATTAATAPTTPPTPATPTAEPTNAHPPPVPDGYHLEDQANRGYSVPVPDDWTKKVTDDGDQVSYVDPTDTVALKISALDYASPDPYQHWLDLEPQTQDKVRNYHRERMETTKTAWGQDAALWQFTFKGTSSTFRAVDLGFGKEGGREYAVYLSAPKSQWTTYKPVFDTAAAGFRQQG